MVDARCRDAVGDTVGGMALAALVAVTLTGGCSSVPMGRFESATRIDVMANPGFAAYQPAFQAQYDRIRGMRGAVCRDREIIAEVYRTLAQYPDGWANYWAVPPESPPVVMIFHSDAQWLGTLDVYERALGHVHNLIHRVPPTEIVEMLRRIVDCAEASEYAGRSAYR